MKKPNDVQRPNSDSGSLGQFYRARGVMVHQSCAVAMLPHPMNPTGPRIVPWVQKPGSTYNVGRNKAKREAKARRAAYMRAAA